MKVILVCTLVVLSVVRAEYPSNVPKCKNGDSPCLVKAATEIVKKYSNGYRELNLLSFDPLHVKSIVLESNPTSPVNVEIALKDVDLFGLKNMQVKSYEGLRADLSGRTVFEAVVPEMKVASLYRIKGRVLLLPITGDGPLQLISKNVHFKFSYDLKPVKKNGKTHVTLEHVKLELTPGHVAFNFENLFNGDKELGDSMNKILNDNWREIYNELSPSFSKAIGLVVKSYMNTFFEKYPYDEYFL